MKKQKLSLRSLQLTKVRVANLQATRGGVELRTDETVCCTEPKVCHPTLTTRPDSINPNGDDKDGNTE